ncbi:Osmosensitive K channel His kinase sensor [Fimbriimonas ginsengisoli Gsoil 348]|uniref:Osmosensitive K channel His kinase sensor n=2 Tax=Fimbriimonas ginsengisoli TaxID=1005039 RepID=A0A068NUV8_FIMGI|nr:Osmosensitive K channel His kinase sensor [Fimbriimonas ginsengisoli Gsoil 348]
MLDEAHRRQRRGQETVIGVIDTQDRAPVGDLLHDFEQVPPGSEELNVDAILARKPDLVIVDELEHKNAPTSRNERRWQDVEELLAAGINVLSTLNVSSLESLNDHVADITGVKVEDTVPDRILGEAYEVELVDLTPRALINRLERGDIYPGRTVTGQESAFFREGNLAALREMAMREAASHVDEDLVAYRKEKRIEKPWAAQDRVMICLSPTRSSLRLIRRGWRMGQRMHGDVIAVHVEDGPIGEKERKILADDFKLAEKLGIETVSLKGELAPTLIDFAKERNVTQLIIGHPERSRIQEIMKASVLSELVRSLKTVDILVVASENAPVGH